MKVTKKWLKEKRACCSEQDMNRAEKELKGDVKLITDTLLKEDRFNDANWLLTKLMDKNQCIKYAIFAAKQVLHIFEEKYPKDDRPRKAIEAAENYLKDPSENNKKAAYDAAYAAYAAGATAYAAADAAIYAATHAATYAAAAAHAATSYTVTSYAAAAAHAATSYTVTSYAAAAADAAHAAAHASDVKTKIIEYGVKILN